MTAVAVFVVAVTILARALLLLWETLKSPDVEGEWQG